MSATKKQRTSPPYELLYHPSIPGRGEFIRLAFEAAGASYTDVANDKDDYKTVQRICTDTDSLTSGDSNPPVFSPPALRVPGAGKDGNALIISQTPNILAYLGEKLGLNGSEDGDDSEKWHVAQVALTALDLNNEVHDTHHPIAVAKYYEDQKDEALKKAADVRKSRLPKFLGYFDRVLKFNRENGGGEGKYLVGSGLTYADTTVWQVLDGCMFAFPKELEARKKEFPDVLDTFYNSIKEEKGLKEYLASKRRLPYSMGVFRHYPELDRQ
ncbi:glutathione S-transferase protein-like protein [Polychaeton citri CBS 116435]|uniref:Glutathione S-transferase protein-like protein n=1 Tax=Polychaeton citri CBS 116435 TaxID=1314669 RepID=A0A9P4Q062_9PEZI|nr:glutathione S-transferase protein-like protein [Polychaeton citri CBS 116435]